MYPRSYHAEHRGKVGAEILLETTADVFFVVVVIQVTLFCLGGFLFVFVFFTTAVWFQVSPETLKLEF